MQLNKFDKYSYMALKVMLILSILFWIFIFFYFTFVKYLGDPNHFMIAAFLFLEPVLFTITFMVTIRKYKKIYIMSVIFVFLNLILSLTDQMGVYDYLSVLMNALVFILMIYNYHIVFKINEKRNQGARMKSVKPGRGPSGMSFIGSIVVIVFGILWTIIAASITRSVGFGIGTIFPIFGVIFVIVGIVQALYHYKNATSKDRFSIVDITEDNEEGDPSDKWIKNEMVDDEKVDESDSELNDFNYCPYCRFELDSDYAYCPKCGKSLKK